MGGGCAHVGGPAPLSHCPAYSSSPFTGVYLVYQRAEAGVGATAACAACGHATQQQSAGLVRVKLLGLG